MDRAVGTRRPARGRRAATWSLFALLLLAGTGFAMAGRAVAQSPEATAAAAPTDAAVGGPVDPRSSGEGPGLEAEPLIVLAGVILLGLAAAGGTALYVRLTRED